MKNKNMFWGLFFIAAGALIIINQLGYLAEISLFSLFFTIILIPVIIKSIRHLNYGGIFFPIALLCIIYAKPLGITNLTPWPVLIAALFATIGFSILFHKSKYNFHFGHHDKIQHIVDCPDDAVIDFNVSFGSSIKYINTTELQRVNLTCSFGAMTVYFDNAVPHPNGTEIYLNASFCGIELYVPKTWKLINQVDVTLGGVDEKKRFINEDGIPIILTGQVSLAGVEIHYI